MKILILSCNTGQGHNSCAAALKSRIESLGSTCEIADSLAFISENISKATSKIHSAVYRKMPELLDVSYNYCDKHPTVLKQGSALRKLVAKIGAPLVKFVREGGFDAVICPHVFPAIMLMGFTDIPKYFLATDYTCGPGVNLCDCDGFFIPDESLKAEFINAGIPSEKIYCTGIPVHQRFAVCKSKADAKRALGIDENTRHLLVACGSMGCGPLGEMAECVEEQASNIHATVICGSNEKLYESLVKKHYSRVTAVGYTDDMPLYMDSADLFLTKPGGISVTESAVKHTPLALINAVAGCETSNYNFFIEHGAAVCGDDPAELISKCTEIIFDDERLQRLSQNIAAISHPDACKATLDIVMGAKL